MGYIQNTLMPGERILHITKIHKIIFIWPIIWFLIMIFFAVLGGQAIPFLAMSFFLFICSIPIVIINYISSEYALTNKRIIGKIGFISRKATDLFLNKVEGIQVDQSIIGRVFDFGTLIITGTGGLKNDIKRIPGPLKFRDMVYAQLNPEENKKSEKHDNKDYDDSINRDDQGRYVIPEL
jgi:uncharacterized membrane protein YdbT with pleckstrin-like domain